MILSLSVPQAWLKYQATNWTPPEFWDAGIAGFILDYNVYASQYAPHHGYSTQRQLLWTMLVVHGAYVITR
ncbi:FimD/PapC N-terminal domain-containing protein [Escherichia coli]|uniref:FimD/PapC N-terminal domain-containing protein n=1 Tax=Escherichia coli TaxID=562 RepID=UPI003F52029C